MARSAATRSGSSTVSVTSIKTRLASALLRNKSADKSENDDGSEMLRAETLMAMEAPAELSSSKRLKAFMIKARSKESANSRSSAKRIVSAGLSPDRKRVKAS